MGGTASSLSARAYMQSVLFLPGFNWTLSSLDDEFRTTEGPRAKRKAPIQASIKATMKPPRAGMIYLEDDLIYESKRGRQLNRPARCYSRLTRYDILQKPPPPSTFGASYHMVTLLVQCNNRKLRKPEGKKGIVK